MEVTDERLDAFEAESPKKDSYGTHECGCSWDSGPYATYCRAHDPEPIIDALLTDAAAALAGAHDDEKAAVARRIERFLEQRYPPTE